jgi:hypothetical protein
MIRVWYSTIFGYLVNSILSATSANVMFISEDTGLKKIIFQLKYK